MSAETAEDVNFERPRPQFPLPPRGDETAVVEDENVPLSPTAPPRIPPRPAAFDAPFETRPPRPGDFRLPPRPLSESAQKALPETPRPTADHALERGGFDSVWPEPRPARETPDHPARDAARTEPVLSRSNGETPRRETPQRSEPAPSILKSGVVEGMAYTLYTDGSIEAELAQGVVRFGSIEELRHHLEKSS
jgi:hypothetical protein